MKNIATLSSAVGLLVFLLVLDLCYWHFLGFHFLDAPILPGILFWIGVLFSLIAVVFAGLGFRKCAKSVRSVGQLIWCSLCLLSYVVFLLHLIRFGV